MHLPIFFFQSFLVYDKGLVYAIFFEHLSKRYSISNIKQLTDDKLLLLLTMLKPKLIN